MSSDRPWKRGLSRVLSLCHNAGKKTAATTCKQAEIIEQENRENTGVRRCSRGAAVTIAGRQRMGGDRHAGGSAAAPAGPLLLLGCVALLLSGAVRMLVWPGGLALFDWTRALILGTAAFLFAGWYVIVSLIASAAEVRSFVDGNTNQVQTGKLLKSVYVNPSVGLMATALAAYGMAGAQNLSEIYREHSAQWHDRVLWQLEEPIFLWVSSTPRTLIAFWDEVYMMLWTFVVCCAAILYVHRRFASFYALLLASVLSFYITRLAAIAFPSAGPAFFKPHLFSLEGTVSAKAQAMLLLYMSGEIPQNGLIPGTMAMPSLHIALIALSTYYLLRHWRWTGLVTIPILCAVWYSTIVLGWHYVLDGAGGILVALLSIAIANRVFPCSPTRSEKLQKNA